MTTFTIEDKLDLGEVGFHDTEITAQVDDFDPESQPRVKITRAVVYIKIMDRETMVDVTERIAPSTHWQDEIAEQYLESLRERGRVG